MARTSRFRGNYKQELTNFPKTMSLTFENVPK